MLRHPFARFTGLAAALVIGVSLTAFSPCDEPPAQQNRYDFRATEAYKSLSDSDREKLEQVHRDFVLLWGALDMYCEDHGKPPESLEALTPHILRELPLDPFASPQAENRHYDYRPGSPGNRAWIISSVGLSGFPYLAERGNVGLYQCKGTWISGYNPMPLE